ncbi:hypothetical protein J7L06_04370 [Candidatus Bathyarchaeota archaeon]|nr:hypothetical protein [Candidatus Bathyarchaeota archaeon]
MKCLICGRESEEEFCEYHRLAYRKLKEAYVKWREATEVSWREYLSEVVKNPFTGEWSKEVARKLLEEDNDETR